MAKINKASRENIWKVRIDVNDPGCIWNINPSSFYYKIIKANNENAAVRGAANYCSRQMQAYPGVHFKYSTSDVSPYYCNIVKRSIIEDNTGITTIKI